MFALVNDGRILRVNKSTYLVWTDPANPANNQGPHAAHRGNPSRRDQGSRRGHRHNREQGGGHGGGGQDGRKTQPKQWASYTHDDGTCERVKILWRKHEDHKGVVGYDKCCRGPGRGCQGCRRICLGCADMECGRFAPAHDNRL